MPVVLEKRGEERKWPSDGTVAGDWAEMRVLQWFRGVCPHKVEFDMKKFGDNQHAAENIRVAPIRKGTNML